MFESANGWILKGISVLRLLWMFDKPMAKSSPDKDGVFEKNVAKA